MKSLAPGENMEVAREIWDSLCDSEKRRLWMFIRLLRHQGWIDPYEPPSEPEEAAAA